MRDMLDQIDRALELDLYYVALLATLSLPDICGAAESTDGEATRTKYIEWFDTHVGDRYKVGGDVFLSGQDCYFFRCSALHQGSSQHSRSAYSRILFVEPGTSSNIFHCNILNDALNIDVRIFCRDILESVCAWLDTVEGTEPFETNMNKFLRRYPTGLPPYIRGVPVIG